MKELTICNAIEEFERFLKNDYLDKDIFSDLLVKELFLEDEIILIRKVTGRVYCFYDSIFSKKISEDTVTQEGLYILFHRYTKPVYGEMYMPYQDISNYLDMSVSRVKALEHQTKSIISKKIKITAKLCSQTKFIIYADLLNNFAKITKSLEEGTSYDFFIQLSELQKILTNYKNANYKVSDKNLFEEEAE